MSPHAIRLMIEAAAGGDLRELGRIYALGAAYAREGMPMPPELGQFMGEALQAVSDALCSHAGRPKAKRLGDTLAGALKASRPGKRGPKTDRRAAGYARILASNIAQRHLLQGMTVEAAIAAVQADPEPWGNPQGLSVEALWLAWRKHRAKFMPGKG